MEAHSHKFRVEIGNVVMKKYRIYLDTKYWVYMRDASTEKATITQTEIYRRLKNLVQKEVAICPLSPHIFYELMNIGDEEKRLKMARVMDELSQQVCFISPLNITGQELLSFMRNSQASAEGKSPFNPIKYVFTKAAFVGGEVYPAVKGIPDEQMNNIRIKFFDHLSKITLVEMLKTAGGDFPLWDRKNLIAKLNQGKDDNQDWNSFHEVFMHEIAGILDVVKDDLEQIWIYLFRNDVGGHVTLEEVRKSESAGLLANMIYNAFDQKKINKELPCFHINASLHTFIRYNKNQRYKENDLIDFSHAAWALPYCDTFFTEKPLHDWMCNNLLKLDKIYDTKILYKEEDVLDVLNSLNDGREKDV